MVGRLRCCPFVQCYRRPPLCPCCCYVMVLSCLSLRDCSECCWGMPRRTKPDPSPDARSRNGAKARANSRDLRSDLSCRLRREVPRRTTVGTEHRRTRVAQCHLSEASAQNRTDRRRRLDGKWRIATIQSSMSSNGPQVIANRYLVSCRKTRGRRQPPKRRQRKPPPPTSKSPQAKGSP